MIIAFLPCFCKKQRQEQGPSRPLYPAAGVSPLHPEGDKQILSVVVSTKRNMATGTMKTRNAGGKSKVETLAARLLVSGQVLPGQEIVIDADAVDGYVASVR